MAALRLLRPARRSVAKSLVAGAGLATGRRLLSATTAQQVARAAAAATAWIMKERCLRVAQLASALILAYGCSVACSLNRATNVVR